MALTGYIRNRNERNEGLQHKPCITHLEYRRFSECTFPISIQMAHWPVFVRLAMFSLSSVGIFLDRSILLGNGPFYIQILCDVVEDVGTVSTPLRAEIVFGKTQAILEVRDSLVAVRTLGWLAAPGRLRIVGLKLGLVEDLRSSKLVISTSLIVTALFTLLRKMGKGETLGRRIVRGLCVCF